MSEYTIADGLWAVYRYRHSQYYSEGIYTVAINKRSQVWRIKKHLQMNRKHMYSCVVGRPIYSSAGLNGLMLVL